MNLLIPRRKGFTPHRPVQGFTLIELLIAITIIALLSAIGFVAYSYVMKQGRDSKRQSDLRSIQSALEQYNSDQGFYPYKDKPDYLYNLGLDEVLNPAATNRTFTNRTSNPCDPGPPGDCPPVKTYINLLPKDPTDSTGATRYQYEAVPTAGPCDNCDNCLPPGVNIKCTSYCLYARLDIPPSPAMTLPTGCTWPSASYNFFVTPP